MSDTNYMYVEALDCHKTEYYKGVHTPTQCLRCRSKDWCARNFNKILVFTKEAWREILGKGFCEIEGKYIGLRHFRKLSPLEIIAYETNDV